MHRLIPLLLLLSACSFDEHRRTERCSSDDGCAPFGVCRDGLCVPADEATPDVDQTWADADAPSDAAAPLDARPDQPDRALALDARPPPFDAAPPPLDAAAPIDARLPLDAAPDPDAAPALPLPEGQAGIPLCENRVLPTRCWRPTDDAYADEHDHDALHGEEPRLWLRERRGHQVWSYLRFDLTALRGRRRPIACELSVLRDDEPSPRDVGMLALHRADPRWSQETLSWDLRPADVGNFPRRTRLEDANIAQLFDVHDWVLAALDAGESALAFRLEPERAPNDARWEVHFHSSESMDRPGASPYLSCRFDAQ